MSNYNIQISWSGKDNLSDTDPAKVISGSDFQTEFEAVRTAVNTKAEINGNAGEDFAANGITASTLTLGGTAVTSTAAELNVLDGVTAFVDEDDMASDSATSIPSQQSVKAYTDALERYATSSVKGMVRAYVSGGDLYIYTQD